MAKKTKIEIELEVDDKGTTKKVSKNSEKLGDSLNKTADGAQKTRRHTDDLSKSTKDLDRNMRGTAKMSSNTTKNFSKMQQGMGGLVGAYATLAAQVFAASAAFQFLSSASDIRNLISGQEALGSVTGTTYKTITNSIIQATDAQLKYAEAARGAAIGTAAGLSSGQLSALGEAAKNASFALGRDLTDSFNRLIRGVTKAEPELLDELGIILRLETATEKYAAKINKTVKDLNSFERTQAVANEVLGQAERKYAAIAEQMDPNAAALAQFAKSFDELVNVFKIGLLDVLTPALNFLSRNTEALAATMALIAVPIVKSIIPNLALMAKQAKITARANSIAAASYKREVGEQKEALLKFVRTEEQAAAASKKASQDILKSKETSSGLDYLRGDEAGSKAGAKSILNAARKQMDEAGEITSGKLENITKEGLEILEDNYDKMDKKTKTFSKKTVFSLSFITAGWKGIVLGMQTAWTKGLSFMLGAARLAAIGINVALGGLAAIGAITMLASVAKEIYRYFVPLSAKEKENISIVEELTDKYETLTEEMGRNAEARRSLLVGSEVQQNVGQTLQGVDVGSLVQDMNALSTVDPNTEGFEAQRKKISEISDLLVDIDPRFEALREEFTENGRISLSTAQNVEKVSNELINLGQELSKLPELMNEASEAFQNLLNVGITETPLSKFVDAQDKLIKGIKLNIGSTTATVNAQKADIKAQTDLIREQKDLEKTVFAGIPRYGQMSEQEQEEIRSRVMRGKSGKQGSRTARLLGEEAGFTESGNLERDGMSGSPLGLDPLLKRLDLMLEGTKEIGTQNTELKKQNALLGRASEEEAKILQNRKAGQLASMQMLRVQGRGISFASKERTLEQQRLQSRLQVAAAEEKLSAAQFYQSELAEDDPRQASAQETVRFLERQVNLVKEQNNLTNFRTTEQAKEIQNQRDLLDIQLQIIANEAKLNKMKAERSFKERTGTFGGMGGGAVAGRVSQRAILEQEKANAQESFETYTKEFENAVASRAADILRASEPSGSIFGAFNAPIKAEAQARKETQKDMGAELANREASVQAAKDELFIFNNLQEITARKAGHEIKALEFKRSNVALSKEEVYFQERVAFLLRKGIELKDIDQEGIRKQAKEHAKLTQEISNQEELGLSLQNNMESAFMAMVDGSKSAKQAFADMTRAILADIAKMIIKQMVLNALQTMKIPGFADGGITPSYAYGGMTPKRDYSTGGIARGPQSGYAATLHGNEAIVPLPNSRSIPVEFPQGGPGGNNNVTVNVTMNSDGTASSETQGDGASMGTLGNAIAKAVQTELQNQKRAGGILSPYGAA